MNLRTGVEEIQDLGQEEEHECLTVKANRESVIQLYTYDISNICMHERDILARILVFV